ncbi:hypothetical protein CK203_017763 [Vitis vinifera]|uniref:Uncharacterized protein n=1 Tax=Vitis vinifera TaxID=29760 RepID=A0A438JGV7_VITVI|nr:hypothetical protein CK203_017763 [Vitis vinifera]
MATKKTVSSARASGVREKATDKLDVKEFRERFCIPNDVVIELLNGRVLVPTEKQKKKPSSSRRNNSTRGSGSLCRRCSRSSSISPRFRSVFIHPNIVPGADGMQHHKHAIQPRPHAAGSGDGTRGGPGCMGGFLEHPARPFSPNYSLVVPGRSGIEGPPRGLGGKGVFGCLSKLFEIDAKERQCKTLLTAQNLMAVVREPQDYVINILPRKMPKEVVPGEHYTVKDLSIYQEAKEADVEKTPSASGGSREEKKRRHYPGGSGQKRGADSPPKKTSGRKRRSCCFHNHPGNLNSDVEAAEAVCATPMEEAGAESQSQPSDDPDRLALVPAKGPPLKRPRSGGEVEMTTEVPAAPVIILNEDAPGKTHPAENVETPRPEQKSPSVASSGGGGNLLMTQLAPPLALLATRTGEWSPRYGSTTRSFTDLLRTTDYMKTFASRRQDIENQLRLRLEEVEASLSTSRKDNEALRVDLAVAKSREESTVDPPA